MSGNSGDRIRSIPAPQKRVRFGRFDSLPAPIRTNEMPDFDLARIEQDDGITVYRRGLIPVSASHWRRELEKRAVPESARLGTLNASLEERIIYKELQRRRVRFSFQTRFLGGRAQLGGLVADFILPEYNAVINPLGTIWHGHLAGQVRDQQQRDLLRVYFGIENAWYPWDYEVHARTQFHHWMDARLRMKPPQAVTELMARFL
jgi:hypothetical protein